MLAHGVSGDLASELAGGGFADGALAGALSEITGPLVGTSGLDQNSQIELQRPIATGAVLVTNGGDADSAQIASNIAASAFENNYLNHTEILELDQANQECLAGGNSDACQRKQELATLSADRDAALKVCAGNNSSGCAALRQNLRAATIELLTKSENGTLYEGADGLFLSHRRNAKHAQYHQSGDFFPRR